MVLAVLDDRKSQTRRLVSRRNTDVDGHGSCPWWDELQLDRAWVDPGPSPAGNPGPYLQAPMPFGERDECVCRLYSRLWIGDVLWVRETWQEYDNHAPDDYPYICYRADGEWRQHDRRSVSSPLVGYAAPQLGPGRWRPAIHMPKWAARLWLRITDVRVERLQDISDDDARAEGFPLPGPQKTRQRVTHPDGRKETSVVDAHFFDARHNFCAVWEYLNGKRAPWASNPWVYVYTFERVERAAAEAA